MTLKAIRSSGSGGQHVNKVSTKIELKFDVAHALELNEDEKGLLKLIETKSPILLNDLKALTGLSNKKWDKSLKGLTKNNLAKVNNTVEGLFVEIV